MVSQKIAHVQHRLNVRWSAIGVVMLAAVFSLPATEASAVSVRVKMACAKDYMTHCRKFSPGSAEVRKCVRAVGDHLSVRCVNALKAAGEVSEKEVADYEAR